MKCQQYKTAVLTVNCQNWYPTAISDISNKMVINIMTIVKYSKNLCKTVTLKKTDYCLMQVKSIAECSKGSILQYFRPSLSYQLSLRLFVYF